MFRTPSHNPLSARSSQTVILRCALLLFAVVMFGTLGFLVIEPDWDLWESLYFTLITITTVGYGDEGISSNGKKFAAVLLFFGIGTATYTISVIVNAAVCYQFNWKSKMEKQIQLLRGHVVVCGFGRMGRSICQRLNADGMEIVVVERDEPAYRAALDEGYVAVMGDASDDELLIKAGVIHAHGVVCVVNDDAQNTFITLSARQLNNAAFIVSRAEAEESVRKMERAGASLVVSPHLTAGENIATAILRPHLTEFLRNSNVECDNVDLNEISVEDGSAIAGMTIIDFGRTEDEIVFVAIKKVDGTTTVRPNGNTRFAAGDVVIVAGHPEDLARMGRQARAVSCAS